MENNDIVYANNLQLVFVNIIQGYSKKKNNNN